MSALEAAAIGLLIGLGLLTGIVVAEIQHRWKR
jgi:hypothetical protein